MTDLDRRATNDFRRREFGIDPERRIAFVCECADEDCLRSVVLTGDEYDQARASGRAVVDPAHDRPNTRGPA